MYKPYPRQQESIDNMVDFVQSKTTRKGIYVYPTGFGKSIVIANVASKFPDKYFINTAPRKELIEQNYKKFLSYGYEASLCSASLNSREVGQITFATVGTLKQYIDFFKDKDVVLLADECDEGSKKDSDLHKFIKGIKKCKVIGTTATPLRLSGGEIKMMNRDKDCFYSSIEDVVQIKEVVNGGYWSKLHYVIGKVDVSQLELNSTGNDYTKDSIKQFSLINDIIGRCVKSVEYMQEKGKKSILIFVSSIDEAKQLEKRIPNCKAVHSKMKIPERDKVIDDFKSGKLDVIAQVNILSVGFDHPPLDGIIFARPTNSVRIWYQGIGRGVRTFDGKEDCMVIDISGNYYKFGKIENITFENTVLMDGWAAFAGKHLLTNYPLDSYFTPTKASLLRDLQRSAAEKKRIANMKFTFGKYKGRTIAEVNREDRGRSYIAWIADEMKKGKWKMYGKKGNDLRQAVYMYMKIE